MAAAEFFLHGGAYHAREGGAALPKGAIAVPRLPGAGEAWDAKAGAFVTDHAVAADMSVSAGHVDTAHVLKMTEAAIVASGIILTHGLLADEAAALGVPIETLARAVLDKTADFRAAEANRRKIKTKRTDA